ncbi:DUF1304 domain-containing protein [Leucobacter zeae]|nr:DUF1304 domain-containing protein [Leucobacter zeae]
MIITALVLAGLAALLHVYIFFLESIAWTKPAALKTFGTTREEAESTRELAFNQGFYNLFLAVVAGVGIAFAAASDPGTAASAAGIALLYAGAGSMLAAALVLFVTSPGKRAAAVKQGALPLLSVLALTVGLLLG